MATISASTTFTIVAATAYPEQVDLVILPENAGTNVRRELHYPNDALPPLVYLKNPDNWTGFDTEPIKALDPGSGKDPGREQAGPVGGV